MEKVVNYATRIVTRKRKFDRISKTRQELGWLTFENMIDYRDCVLVHSLLYQENAPFHLKALATYRADISERSTRATAAGLLHVPRARLERTRLAAPIRSLNTWNALDEKTRVCRSDFTFKKNVKKSMLTKL